MERLGILICSMSLLRPPPENIYPGVNLDFASHPLHSPSSTGLRKIPSSGLTIDSGICINMKKYEGNMKKYEGNMEKI